MIWKTVVDVFKNDNAKKYDGNFYYTGWNFLSLDDIRKIAGSSARRNLLAFQKLNNQKLFFPINVGFIIDDGSKNVMGTRKRAISPVEANISEENVLIVVYVTNLFNHLFKEGENISGDVARTSLKGLVAHELTHVTEQYVRKDFNAMDGKKNGLYNEFITNEFNLAPDDYALLEGAKLAYDVSVEEQHARLNQLNTILDKAKYTTNPQRSVHDAENVDTNDLTSLLLRYSNKIKKWKGLDNFKYSMAVAFLKFGIVQDSSRLSGFYKRLNDLTRQMPDKESSERTAILLGYYLFKNNILLTKKKRSPFLNDNNLFFFFSKENIRTFLNEGKSKMQYIDIFDNVVSLVISSISDSFIKYERKVYQIVCFHLNDMLKKLGIPVEKETPESFKKAIDELVLNEKAIIIRKQFPGLSTADCKSYARKPEHLYEEIPEKSMTNRKLKHLLESGWT